MPKMDSVVSTPEGRGRVTNVNFILKQVSVRIKDTQHVFHLDEIEFKQKASQEKIVETNKELLNLEE